MWQVLCPWAPPRSVTWPILQPVPGVRLPALLCPHRQHCPGWGARPGPATPCNWKSWSGRGGQTSSPVPIKERGGHGVGLRPRGYWTQPSGQDLSQLESGQGQFRPWRDRPAARAGPAWPRGPQLPNGAADEPRALSRPRAPASGCVPRGPVLGHRIPKSSHNSEIFPQLNVPISIITAFVIHLENMVFLMLTLKKQSVPHPSIQMAPILNNSFEMESKYIQIDVSEMSCILNTFV